MDLIEIQTQDLEDAIVIHVHGEVDLATAPMLQNALQSALQSGRPVVVDLANATYVDLTGFRVLEDSKRAVGERQALVVAGSSPLVHKVIEIIELDTILPVFHSPQDALDFVRSHRRDDRDKP